MPGLRRIRRHFLPASNSLTSGRKVPDESQESFVGRPLGLPRPPRPASSAWANARNNGAGATSLGLTHSIRNARDGSMRDARRAGINAAAVVTISNTGKIRRYARTSIPAV